MDSMSNDPNLILSDEFNDDCSDDSDDHGHSKNAPLREQDRFLPIANIAKIMKRAIPDNGKVYSPRFPIFSVLIERSAFQIAKDARECIQECVSEFISFITSEASERCQNEKRKTINGEDILYAMVTLGFDNYVEPLTLYLHKYREVNESLRGNRANSASSLLFRRRRRTGTSEETTRSKRPPRPTSVSWSTATFVALDIRD